MIYPILGFIAGLLVGIVFVLANKISANDIKHSVKKLTKSNEKAFIVEEDNTTGIERLLNVKHEQND